MTSLLVKTVSSNARMSKEWVQLDRKRLGSSNLTHRQKLLLFAICSTYVTAVPLRQFLSSINPDLKNDKNLNFTNELAGIMYVVAGLGYSVGKLLDGIFIDKWGPIKCFIFFQIITCLGVLVFTFLDDIYYFSIILCINAFVQAGLWPSLSKLIYEIFSPAQFGCAFACLGISSRLGSAYSKSIIGYLLYLEFTWQYTIRVICILGLFGLIWFILWMTIYFKPKKDCIAFAYPQYNQIKHVLNKGNHIEQERIKNEINRQLNGEISSHEVRYNEETIFSSETLYNKLIRMFTNKRFLLICLSNMFITMVIGLDAFSELLLSDVLKPITNNNMDNGIFVMIASAFPIGLTISLLISYVFLRDKKRYWIANYVNMSLLFAILFCILLLLWIWIMEIFGSIFNIYTSLLSVSLLLFFYGYLLAYPYYIQTGVFALRFGGNDAGLVACLIDFCGYLPSSILLIVGAYISQYGWRYVFVLTIINICLATVSFMYFNHYDVIHERKEQIILINMIQANSNIRSLEEIVPNDIIDGSNLGLINQSSDDSDIQNHESFS
eukprot:519878_1